MKHAMRLRFQKGDVISIVLVLLLAAVVFTCFLPNSEAEAAVAEVFLNGSLVERIPLDAPREMVVAGAYRNTITVADGRIAISASDCPGEDCVSCGWIGASGRSIVCLPNGVEIRVVGDADDVDFVVG